MGLVKFQLQISQAGKVTNLMPQYSFCIKKKQMNFLQVDIFRQNGWSKHKYIGLIWAIYIAIYRLAQPSCNYQSIISSIFK